jgi:hypothetical protein
VLLSPTRRVAAAVTRLLSVRIRWLKAPDGIFQSLILDAYGASSRQKVS